MTQIAESAHILVVDDNEVNRDMLRLRLELRGYVVADCEGGRQVLDLLNTGGPAPFDAVLLDIMMPEVSGLDVLREVRKTRTVAELPVIMTTAKDQSEDIVEALSLGANDYVTKPIDFPVLFARLETHLRLRRLAAEKDEFLAIASHDLKNPLAVIRGFSGLVPVLVPEGQPMTGEVLDLIGRIQHQTVTMERIINDFLDFQAMEEGRLAIHAEPVNFAALVREVADSLEEQARKKEIALEVISDDPSVPPVAGEQLRLCQIAENLLSNGVKYTPRGGRVEARLSTERSESGVQVVLEVSDTGPGIPADEFHRLFKKYSRLSTTPTGGEKSSGVGLAICKRLVDLHGGCITAGNNPAGPGALFRVALPVADAA